MVFHHQVPGLRTRRQQQKRKEKSFSNHMFVIARFTRGGDNLYPASTRLTTPGKMMKSLNLKDLLDKFTLVINSYTHKKNLRSGFL